MGGLGNQMFQYAYAKQLKKSGYEVKLDATVYTHYQVHQGMQLDLYHTDIPIATVFEIKEVCHENPISQILDRFGLNNRYKIKEKNLLFDAALLAPRLDQYIEGYFQSECYFRDIRENILKDFMILKPLSSYTQCIQDKILSTEVSCSLHIRRGDYIANKNTLKVHGICSLEYYQQAMSKVEKMFGDVYYFVFSDDIDWAKKHMQSKHIKYIQSNEKRIPHEDIYLMSICQHNIIANSSFSWWGAWLNQNIHKTVIAPKRWFSDKKMLAQAKDIVPKEWIKL